jgi:hypothetical protein
LTAEPGRSYPRKVSDAKEVDFQMTVILAATFGVAST